MNDKTIVLLLTSTINTKGLKYVERDSIIERYRDYYNSLKLWIRKQNLLRIIVFCENSGYNLTQLKKDITDFASTEEKVIEFLSFNERDTYREKGKGYGESKIINYTLKHSELLRKSDYFVKASGRYFIKNIDDIIRKLPCDFDFSSIFSGDLKTSQTQVIIFKTDIYKKFFTDVYVDVNDSQGIYFEHIVGRRILKLISDGYKWVKLPLYPYIVGYSGSSGKKVNTLKYGIKILIKNLIIKALTKVRN